MQHEIFVRKFEPQDRAAVRKISYETAFFGRAKEFVSDQEVVADSLTLYFTDYEPESAFVAVSDGRVVAYLIGTCKIPKMNRVFSQKILPALCIKTLRKGLLLRKREWQFILSCAQSYLKGEFNVPNLSQSYPSTFHINVEEPYRHMGIGHQLIEAFLEYLRSQGIGGIYVSTLSEKARDFFSRLGFQLLFTGPKSYLKYRLGVVTSLYMLGRQL